MAIKQTYLEDEFDTSMLDFELFETADEAVKNIKIEVDNDDEIIKKDE